MKIIGIYMAAIIAVTVSTSSAPADISSINKEVGTYKVIEISSGIETKGKIESKKQFKEVEIPAGYDNSFKAYMDYRCITDTESKQYKMQQQAYTDKNGIRKIGDYYCVAMGSGICSELGKKYEVELENGSVIKVIQADQKADCHTDSSNRFIELGDGKINIVEFIVSTEHLPSMVRIMGNLEHTPSDIFKGQIVKMREVVDL
ncbi:hypothetical protein AALA22_13025 [Anaerovoracaceae bacterium 41-7]